MTSGWIQQINPAKTQAEMNFNVFVKATIALSEMIGLNRPSESKSGSFIGILFVSRFWLVSCNTLDHNTNPKLIQCPDNRLRRVWIEMDCSALIEIALVTGRRCFPYRTPDNNKGQFDVTIASTDDTHRLVVTPDLSDLPEQRHTPSGRCGTVVDSSVWFPKIANETK
jgi:hypothetical protein